MENIFGNPPKNIMSSKIGGNMIEPIGGAQSLGRLTDSEKEIYYNEILSLSNNKTALYKGWVLDQDRRLYEARETVVAYISKSNEIVPASSLTPEKSLQNALVDITLDRFHVQRYPGSSQHTIQINFSIEHLVNLDQTDASNASVKQDILYGYIVEAVDEQAVPPTGAAVFRNLRISSELQMKIATINVIDRVDQRILEVLKSDIVRKGLTLVSTANPSFSIVSELFLGTTKMFLSRNSNKAIHEIPIGFLINGSKADPKLREGSYVLIQADVKWLEMGDYHWNPLTGCIEHKILGEELPFNYMVFSIRKSLSMHQNV